MLKSVYSILGSRWPFIQNKRPRNVFLKYFQLNEFPIKSIFRIQGHFFVIIYVILKDFLSQTGEFNINSFKKFNHLLCFSSGDVGIYKTDFAVNNLEVFSGKTRL